AFSRDWSSDVCSSDLLVSLPGGCSGVGPIRLALPGISPVSARDRSSMRPGWREFSQGPSRLTHVEPREPRPTDLRERFAVAPKRDRKSRVWGTGGAPD